MPEASRWVPERVPVPAFDGPYGKEIRFVGGIQMNCEFGSRRYTSGGPARCAGGYTAEKCRCQPEPSRRDVLIAWLKRQCGRY